MGGVRFREANELVNVRAKAACAFLLTIHHTPTSILDNLHSTSCNRKSDIIDVYMYMYSTIKGIDIF